MGKLLYKIWRDFRFFLAFQICVGMLLSKNGFPTYVRYNNSKRESWFHLEKGRIKTCCCGHRDSYYWVHHKQVDFRVLRKLLRKRVASRSVASTVIHQSCYFIKTDDLRKIVTKIYLYYIKLSGIIRIACDWDGSLSLGSPDS